MQSTIERGCGRRIPGGIYLVSDTSPFGLPIESFLLDPPVEVRAELKLPKRGVAMIERDGTYYVADHVGSEHYPNAADVIEEARRFGVSRRISRKFDFSLLTPESRLLLAHARGLFTNWRAYRKADAEGAPYPCPRSDVLGQPIENHRSGREFCADLWWHDLEVGERVSETGNIRRGRPEVLRRMPSFNYLASKRPVGIEPQYVEAFILAVPISGIDVVRDPLDPVNEARSRAAVANAGVPVEIVDA